MNTSLFQTSFRVVLQGAWFVAGDVGRWNHLLYLIQPGIEDRFSGFERRDRPDRQLSTHSSPSRLRWADRDHSCSLKARSRACFIGAAYLLATLSGGPE
ncbi:MAG: hypothetical protein ACO3I0_12420, partial [Limisphaerales bacterium]